VCAVDSDWVMPPAGTAGTTFPPSPDSLTPVGDVTSGPPGDITIGDATSDPAGGVATEPDATDAARPAVAAVAPVAMAGVTVAAAAVDAGAGCCTAVSIRAGRRFHGWPPSGAPPVQLRSSCRSGCGAQNSCCADGSADLPGLLLRTSSYGGSSCVPQDASSASTSISPRAPRMSEDADAPGPPPLHATTCLPRAPGTQSSQVAQPLTTEAAVTCAEAADEGKAGE